MARANPIPEGFHTVTPILTLEDADQAIEWYKQALGAEELARSLGPDGKIMHAELRIGDSRIMLHDAMMGEKGPKGLGGSPSEIWLYVTDCDALFERAVKAGAKVGMPMDHQFWGDRCGNITDPHGYRWTIATRVEDLTRQEIEQRQAEFFRNFRSQAKKE